MKIALLGYGKMGRLVEKAARERGHEIIARWNSKTRDPIAGADICIDFSSPEAVLENIEEATALGKNIVIGTTGWDQHLEDAKRLVEKSGTGMLYAPNFSIGIHLFLKMVTGVAALINACEDYDIAVFEEHHRSKKDLPSGTAKAIGEILLENINRKISIASHVHDRAINPEELHVSALRCGHAPGTHSVIFDSECDTITLTHAARNREGFARGAIAAAGWLHGKRGSYTLHNMLFEHQG